MKLKTVKIGTVVIIFISMFLLGSLIYQFVPLYGNNIDSIKKVIARNYDVVSLVDVKDIQNYRIVGFVSTNQRLGYAVFHKNSFHNYQWEVERVAEAPSGIYSFSELLPEYKDSDGKMQSAHIIVSNSPNLAKVKRFENKQYMDEKDVGSCPSMVVMDYDTQDSSKITLNYYDEGGNEIHIK